MLAGGYALSIAEIADGKGDEQRYFPAAVRPVGRDKLRFGAPTLSATLAKLRRVNRVGALTDAATDPRFAEALVDAMREDRRIVDGTLVLEPTGRRGSPTLEASTRPGRSAGSSRTSPSPSATRAS